MNTERTSTKTMQELAAHIAMNQSPEFIYKASFVKDDEEDDLFFVAIDKSYDDFEHSFFTGFVSSETLSAFEKEINDWGIKRIHCEHL